MIHTFPLKLDNNPVRSRSTVGIYELNDRIVFIHDELGDVPKEQITKDTVFPKTIHNGVRVNFCRHSGLDIQLERNC